MTKKLSAMAITATVISVMWVGGCQENQASDIKTARLIAVENKDLKAQIQTETKKRDEETAKLKEQLRLETKKRDSEIQSLSDSLAGCERGRTAGFKELEQKQKEQLESVLSPVIAENQKLSAEIERLQTEIAKSKGESAPVQK
jgi:outer membrane murein-binding lipoprotein Lpp